MTMRRLETLVINWNVDIEMAGLPRSLGKENRNNSKLDTHSVWRKKS